MSASKLSRGMCMCITTYNLFYRGNEDVYDKTNLNIYIMYMCLELYILLYAYLCAFVHMHVEMCTFICIFYVFDGVKFSGQE